MGLPIMEEVRGSLNVYAGRERAFTRRAVARAESFARYAAVGIGNAYLYESVTATVSRRQAMMDSQAVVEQAKGIVVQRLRCTPDAAFTVLTRLARETHREIDAVAAVLVAEVGRREVT
jgi:AmiR/NasT family two-component response regulator